MSEEGGWGLGEEGVWGEDDGLGEDGGWRVRMMVWERMGVWRRVEGEDRGSGFGWGFE